MADRIAQLILEKIDTPPVEEVQGLESIVRGIGGFSSIGVKSGNDTGEKKKQMVKMNEPVKRKVKRLKMRL